jgi:type IV pilus assembly protein PilC
MHVTMDSGMDLRRALQLSLQSTHNIRYTAHTDQVLASIRAGREIHEAFAQTRVFPREFLDAVAVGEQSGLLVESLARLSDQYQDEAQSALKASSVLAGFLVWGMVALVIVMVIFRIFGAYMNVLNEAGRM